MYFLLLNWISFSWLLHIHFFYLLVCYVSFLTIFLISILETHFEVSFTYIPPKLETCQWQRCLDNAYIRWFVSLKCISLLGSELLSHFSSLKLILPIYLILFLKKILFVTCNFMNVYTMPLVKFILCILFKQCFAL